MEIKGKVFIVTGGASGLGEGTARMLAANGATVVVADMQAVANAMSTAGFGPAEKQFVIESDGKHSEWFWAREFPDAYVWLFQNAVSTDNTANAAAFGVYPNPAGDWIRLSGFESGARVKVQILGADGKLWRDSTLGAGDALWTGDLPPGAYIVKARVKGKAWKTARLILQ